MHINRISPRVLFAVFQGLMSTTASCLAADTRLAADGVQVVSFYGYEDCIQLKNASTEVILCPAAGGRVLKYALGGRNVLYLPAGDEGWTWDGQAGRGNMNAGRFDPGSKGIDPDRVARLVESH